jgi:glycosyltransferase involved in cell wall biosynthesis
MQSRAVGEGAVGEGTERADGSAALRGCRIVTTSVTARLLLRHQLRSLRDVSWTVVSGDAFDEAPRELDVEVVPLRRELAPSDARAFVRMWRRLRHRKFDFVQTHTQKASLIGLPAARLSGTKAIYTVHGAMYFADNSRSGNLAGWVFEKWCCSWANMVLVQSREDLNVLTKARICPMRKLRFVGNGIGLQHFFEPVAPAFSSGRPVVLMVSRLVKEKGCSDFVQLAKSLAGKADFVHVGPAEADQRDGLSAAELEDASQYVTFFGAVDDVRPFLACADLVVQPSYREGIPRVVMEAAATGRPVVGYDVRGVREVIDPASGLLVSRGDVAALVELVGSLLADPARRAELGRACRNRVVTEFSEDKVVRRLRAAYLELCPSDAPVPAATAAEGP